MKKVELLSPVGNKEMLYQAIHNGADAIYLAGTLYGARKYAKNFTNEELKEAIEYAHLYDVKVYVTVNIMIYENELEDAIKYIEFLYTNNVDALIMQDIGLMKIVRKRFPNLEIHASTQCHNHNNSGLKLWKELGIKRVVLDRELSKEEIKNLKVDIEKEVFIYGALCICYSGCCLFSSLNGGRSGNRGECVGCCRLPYHLKGKKEKYPLSTKELNTLNYLPELIDLGIDCFKIEGRMKSPSYVGYVTKCARNIIDEYYKGRKKELTKEEEINLKKLYNRGFTKGYLFNEKNIVNSQTPNHQGIKIGYVINTNKSKIKIKLTEDSLYQEDGIRFLKSNIGLIVNHLYNEKGLLTNKIEKGSIGYLDKKNNIIKDDIILKTKDIKLIETLENIEEKKIPINITVIGKINHPIKITITDGINQIEKVGPIIEKSLTSKVEPQNFIKQLSKLGNTPYTLNKLNLEIDDNIFISLSTLNKLRRELTEELTKLRKEKKTYEPKIYLLETIKPKQLNPTNKKNIHILVRNEQQLLEVLKYNPSSIYVTEEELYSKYKNKTNIYLRIDRVNIEEKEIKNQNLLIGDLGSYFLYIKNNNIVTDYYLNIANHSSINVLNNNNTQRITLSVELDINKIKDIMTKTEYNEKIEIFLYGRRELMIIKHQLSKENTILEDEHRNQYPIIIENNLTHILESSPLNNIEKIKQYQELGIINYRIELLNETKKEIENIFKQI